MVEIAYFEGVLGETDINDAISRHGLDQVEIYKRGSYGKGILHNNGLKISKDSWTVPVPAEKLEGINIHFECKQRGTLQIHIEVFPYEGSIAKSSARLEELREHMNIKEELIKSIRAAATRNTKWRDELRATTANLKAAEVPSTICALKFVSEKGERADLKADVAFYCAVIDEVSPYVDRLVATAISRLNNRG